MRFNEYGQCQLQVKNEATNKMHVRDSMKTNDASKDTTKQYRATIRDYKRLRVPIINNDYDDDDNEFANYDYYYCYY